MQQLLIITPHFPPINAPDMQRVRLSLPHFREFGWDPIVLTVDPASVEGAQDALLLESLPNDVPVHRVSAFSPRWTRKMGIGALGLRALAQLNSAGNRILRERKVRLAYFSTTAFPVMTLGRLWRRRHGIPYVLDMQDPWVSDYYDRKPRAERPPKYALAQRMHRLLEPWTMKRVDGLIAVTSTYHETLRARYPWIRQEACRTVPFGASSVDFEIADRHNFECRFFDPHDGNIHAVYVGVLGKVMRQTCTAFCLALKQGRARHPAAFEKLRFHFVGTDYSPAATPSIEPIARELGVDDMIDEVPQRVPYFEALNLLRRADLLVMLGSDNPDYTASKLYPYVLARKPMLVVFHRQSSVAGIVEDLGAAELVSYDSIDTPPDLGGRICTTLRSLLGRLPFEPGTDWRYFEQFTARNMTRRQCELFDIVTATSPAGRLIDAA